MSATTTQTIHLIDCPACKEHVIAKLTYSVKLNQPVYAEGEQIGPIDKTATATLTLTGVRILHECPTISACGPRNAGWPNTRCRSSRAGSGVADEGMGKE